MANIARTTSRLLVSSVNATQTSYICPKCRTQPTARYARRQASTKSASPASPLATKQSPPQRLSEGPDVSEPTQVSVAAPVQKYRDPSADPGYVPATTWDNLERVGSKAWMQKSSDPGDAFEGWSRSGRTEIDVSNIDEVMGKVVEAAFGGAALSSQSIADRNVKIKLMASVAEITGVRLPDFKMQKANTLDDVRQILLAKPKSALFASGGSERFAATPNVQLRSTRQTRVHKDEAKGGWKLIEEGLRQRGLPVWGKDVTTKRKLL